MGERGWQLLVEKKLKRASSVERLRSPANIAP